MNRLTDGREYEGVWLQCRDDASSSGAALAAHRRGGRFAASSSHYTHVSDPLSKLSIGPLLRANRAKQSAWCDVRRPAALQPNSVEEQEEEHQLF
jgi:hypothetical protein